MANEAQRQKRVAASQKRVEKLRTSLAYHEVEVERAKALLEYEETQQKWINDMPAVTLPDLPPSGRGRKSKAQKEAEAAADDVKHVPEVSETPEDVVSDDTQPVSFSDEELAEMAASDEPEPVASGRKHKG